jgi:hypothetical protein
VTDDLPDYLNPLKAREFVGLLLTEAGVYPWDKGADQLMLIFSELCSGLAIDAALGALGWDKDDMAAAVRKFPKLTVAIRRAESRGLYTLHRMIHDAETAADVNRLRAILFHREANTWGSSRPKDAGQQSEFNLDHLFGVGAT